VKGDKNMDIKAFLIDMDGVLYVGERPIEGATETIDLLNERGYRYRFVTNATRRCRSAINERLKRLGFNIREELIFSAPLATILYIKSCIAEPRCYLLSTGDVHRDFENNDIILTDDDPNFVVIGDAGEDFTYLKLNKAFRFVLDGAEFIAMEKDQYWMSHDGLVMGAGPFVAAIEFSTSKRATVTGKPSEEFFRHALHDLRVNAEECAIIGDDLFSDVAGGKNLGIKGILVKTGKYRDDLLKKSEIKPDIVLNSISQLREYL